ncbi:MAG: transporter substrate-binding domain-containing protein [Variovorax sp.]|nr:MAG: transporter substrate-binding domain-containing protein [Variovorax sp.]
MTFALLRIALATAALAVSLSATVASAQTCTPAVPKSELIAEGKIMLSTNPTLPPLQFVDASGELKGMNLELAAELGRRLCLKAETVRMDFPAMIPALKAARFDGINTGMFFTEERSRVMWTIPYAMAAIDIVAVPGSKRTIGSPDALSDLAIGVEADSYQERWLKEREKDNVAKGRKPLRILSFPTASEVMAGLRAGQFDIAAFPNYAGGAFVKAGQATMLLPAQGASPTMMSFRSKPVADAVVKAFNDMIKDGTYDRILDQYGMTKLPERVIAIRGTGPV